jgi:aryl-alcohol dehydrogenase-like predicted oxidoreductase
MVVIQADSPHISHTIKSQSQNRNAKIHTKMSRTKTPLKAVDELHKEGYLRRFGISNYMAWEVARICEICREKGYIMPSVYQGVYNALHRSVEPELFECLRYFGLAFYN